MSWKGCWTAIRRRTLSWSGAETRSGPSVLKIWPSSLAPSNWQRSAMSPETLVKRPSRSCSHTQSEDRDSRLATRAWLARKASFSATISRDAMSCERSST
jgi:hypothetical protein